MVASSHDLHLLTLNLTRLGSSLASHFFPLSLTKTEIDFCRFPQFRLDLLSTMTRHKCRVWLEDVELEAVGVAAEVSLLRLVPGPGSLVIQPVSTEILEECGAVLPGTLYCRQGQQVISKHSSKFVLPGQ